MPTARRHRELRLDPGRAGHLLLRLLVRWAGPASVVLALLAIGIGVSRYKLSLVRDIRYVGHADSAAYVLMGQSLAEGRGLQVDYVSWFFHRYPRDITHREDHWPPFLAWCIAACFKIHGIHPWAAKLAPIYIGSIGLPLAAAALAMALSRRTYVGLLAGLAMLASPILFTESLRTLSDIAPAMLAAAFCAALIGARYRPWLHLLAGVLAAMAYYSKGSQLVLLALYPLLTVLTSGPRALVRKWMWLGLATAALLLAPWFWSNWRLYGNPLHCTQNYVSGYTGLVGWEEGTYPIYWNKPLPRTSDRWTKYKEQYPRVVAANREAFARWLLLGPGADRNAWDDLGPWAAPLRDWLQPDPKPSRNGRSTAPPHVSARGKSRQVVLATPPPPPPRKPLKDWQEPLTMLSGLVAVAAVALAAVFFILGASGTALWRRWRARRRLPTFLRMAERPYTGPVWDASWLKRIPRDERKRLFARRDEPIAQGDPTADEPWLLGPVLAVVLVLAVQWAFLVYLWHTEARFSFVFMPFVAALAATGASRLLELPLLVTFPRIARGWHWVLTVILAITAVAVVRAHQPELKQLHRQSVRMTAYPYADELFYPRAGDWIKANLPNAVIMCRNPWELRFYCASTNKAVNIPLASPEDIFSVARYYRVTHLLRDTQRRGMDQYYSGRQPGLKPVPGAPAALYELDYGELPWRPIEDEPPATRSAGGPP